MQIIDFTTDHMEQATEIARQNYETERRHVTELPPVEIFAELSPFVENNLGVSAFDNGKMLGFLCSFSPFKNAFGSTDAVGVFSPMHANGTIFENRAQIYARMYQAAAKKWMEAGASSHAVCLYAHDKTAHDIFFQYGFGLRSVDAIRLIEEIHVNPCPDYEFMELDPEEYLSVLPLDHMLDAHFASNPIFMLKPSCTEETFIESVKRDNPRYFAAKKRGAIVAFIKIKNSAETFICNISDMKNICGAFCLPELRGIGIYQNLLNFMIKTLKAEGYARLGVDFEGFNPTAYGFWPKYFTAYTNGVVRRIDEHVLKDR